MWEGCICSKSDWRKGKQLICGGRIEKEKWKSRHTDYENVRTWWLIGCGEGYVEQIRQGRLVLTKWQVLLILPLSRNKGSKVRMEGIRSM